MAKKANKQVKMPAKISQRLMAAVAMLLVSTIMLVSATYAWFTLSTAPEVTGITTQVGANGNLEIALLNTTTYADLDSITSGTSDSMSVQADTAANITWGNLVDLSDTSYGLSEITLLPAQANIDSNVLDTTSLLKTASYGYDGRVSAINVTTVSAIYASGFSYTAGSQTYGVRAIGTATGMSTRQLKFAQAKASVAATTETTIASSTRTAVNSELSQFIGIVMGGSSTATSYTYEQVAAMKKMVAGATASVESIVKFYSNVAVAAATSTSGISDDTAAETAAQSLTTTDAATLKDAITSTGITFAYESNLTALADAQTALATATTAINSLIAANTEKVDFTTTSDFNEGDTEDDAAYIKTNILNALVGETVTYTAYDEDDQEVSGVTSATVLGGDVETLYVSSGVFGTIAAEIGTFQLADELLGVTCYAGAKGTASQLAAPTAVVNALTAPSGASTATISDTYGYAVDFAFRTNAADSKLQLQTAAANRYSSDASTGTQGSGSNVSFTLGNGATDAQATAMLEAITIVFFDPDTGAVYAQASLGTPTIADGVATADIKLAGQDDDDTAEITDLQQNTAKRVSVLVYLDGSKVDNGDVLNASKSGDLKLNLQFSSSATLVPMNNTALKQLTK